LVVEFFDRLLPRQLDGAGASILQGQIEKMGIEVRCGAVTEEILGGDSVSGLKFKDGSTVEADMIVCASGVVPDTDMAKSSGLDVNKGILVDDRLRTCQPDIFAAGDVSEHRNRIYGLIPAAFEQSRIAAYNMLGMEKIYEGTLLSNTLKVVGLQVTSVGDINPEGDGYEVLSRQLPEEGIYKKLVLKDGIVCGAIWMGTKKGIAEISRLVSNGVQVDRWREDLLEDNFDFSEILP
jgi:nitrite reductase (NADH) large subunit